MSPFIQIALHDAGVDRVVYVSADARVLITDGATPALPGLHQESLVADAQARGFNPVGAEPLLVTRQARVYACAVSGVPVVRDPGAVWVSPFDGRARQASAALGDDTLSIRAAQSGVRVTLDTESLSRMLGLPRAIAKLKRRARRLPMRPQKKKPGPPTRISTPAPVSDPVRDNLLPTWERAFAAFGQSLREAPMSVHSLFSQRVELVKRALRSESPNLERIARTESAVAFGLATFYGLLRLGYKEGRWMTMQDDRVRDSHQECHGVKRRLGEPFPNGLLFPGDPSGPPEEVINCRCWLVPAG
jgi:hypothetical protein